MERHVLDIVVEVKVVLYYDCDGNFVQCRQLWSLQLLFPWIEEEPSF